jgi:hypothetical protein
MIEAEMCTRFSITQPNATVVARNSIVGMINGRILARWIMRTSVTGASESRFSLAS